MPGKFLRIFRELFWPIRHHSLLGAGLLIAFWPLAANASVFGCDVALTSVQASRVATRENKKLVREEFRTSAVAPSATLTLKKGTELDVLVDGACLKDSARGARKLQWLKNLRVPVGRSSSLRSVQWRLEEDWDFSHLQDIVEAEPCIQLVSPDGHFKVAQVARDPLVNDQTQIGALRLQQALPDFLEPMMIRYPVAIAIIDTGVDLTHPDLSANRWINPGEIPGNGIDDDDNGYVDDVNGFNFAKQVGESGPTGGWADNIHGTHVAGLAAARLDNGRGGIGIHGVAKIMSLNVFMDNGESRSSILENAIRYAADQGAAVLNMSLGGNEYSRTMRSALQYAIARGSFIAAAAGNFSVELCEAPSSFGFMSPGVYAPTLNGMLVVGSVDIFDGKFSRFSNYSSRLLEITAPGALTSIGAGSGILSTAPGNVYVYLHGTSMSTPLVSGAAALVSSWLRAYHYDSRPATVEGILRSAARKDPALIAFVQEGRTLDLLEIANFLKTNYPPRTKKEAQEKLRSDHAGIPDPTAPFPTPYPEATPEPVRSPTPRPTPKATPEPDDPEPDLPRPRPTPRPTPSDVDPPSPAPEPTAEPR